MAVCESLPHVPLANPQVPAQEPEAAQHDKRITTGRRGLCASDGLLQGAVTVGKHRKSNRRRGDAMGCNVVQWGAADLGSGHGALTNGRLQHRVQNQDCGWLD